MVSPVSAQTSYTWTSTADFDGGTKSDSGDPWFSSNGIDQPMNWINYPAAQHYQGKTYVVWQGDTGWRPYLSVYDHAMPAWSGPYLIASSNPLAGAQDGHGAPSILIDTSGLIHVFFGSHSSVQKYSRSSVSDPSSWTAMGDPDVSATYPHPVQYGNSIYLFFRVGSLPTAPVDYRVSTDGGASWGARTFLLNFAAGTPYLYGVERSGTRLYFTFNYYSPTDQLRHNLYAGYFDFSDSNVYSVGGTNLGTEADLTEANNSLRVENSGSWVIESTGIHVDASNNPYIIYRSGVGTTNWRYNFTRWTGTAWTAAETIRTTDRDVGNEGDFIVRSSTSVEAFLVGPGLGGEGGDIERWTWNGATWSQVSTLISQLTSSKALGAALVPKDFHDGMRVIFNQIDFTNYTRDGLRLYAWGAAGFVNNSAISSGVYAVETTTDDAQITSGAVELSSGKGDTFSLADSNGNTSRWNTGFKIASGGSLTGVCTTLNIAGGVSVAAVSKDQLTECVWSSAFAVSGNFDVRIKTSSPIDGSGRRLALCVLDQPGTCDYGVLPVANTLDGFVYSSDLDGAVISSWNVSSGTFTQIGTSTNGAAEPLWLRIDRSGNTFSFRYSSNGASWTLDETIMRGNAPSSFIVLFSYINNGVTDGTANFDDYVLAAGTVGPGGYRTSGSWTSPGFAIPSNERVAHVAMTYSGLSATKFIDKMEVLRDGIPVWTSNADITSGTSTNVTATGWGGGSMQVRITLASDGAGTPVLESVTATVAANSGLVIWGWVDNVWLRLAVFVMGIGATFMLFKILDTKAKGGRIF